MRRALGALSLAAALVAGACSDAAQPARDAGFAEDAADLDAGALDALDVDAAPADAGALDARPALDAAEPLPDGSVEPLAWAPFAVLTINLHCLKLDGSDYTSNADRFAAIAALAASEDVGVVIAQEVCVRTGGESAEVSLRGALETATSTAWSSRWAYAHDAWTGTPDAAREGLAVFARGTGAIVSAADVPHHAQGSLRRMFIAATLSGALGGLTVHSAHLDHAIASIRAKQARELASWSVARADPGLDLLVAGDFNASPGSEPPGALLAFGYQDAAAALGEARIDHVFLHRGARAAVTSARFAFDGTREPHVSDHPGVLVHLAPAAAPRVQATRFTADAPWTGLLFLRGDASPLGWDVGWPALPLGQGQWRVVLTELVADHFEYKWLRDDVTWEAGANEQGVRGGALSTAPEFP